MSLFRKGFAHYLDSGQYSDLVLISEHGRVKVHRLVLSYSSEVFCRMLMGEFREKNQQEIELKYPDPENIFPIALRYMYTGEAPLTIENAIPLLALGDHYLIKNLKTYCTTFIYKNITKTNVLEMLKKSLQYQATDILEHCCDVISKSFFSIINSDFSFIPFPIFSKILHHKYLAEENELYQCIVNYIKSFDDEISQEQMSELMECIRFTRMHLSQFQQCLSDSLVPKQLLIEAMMFRLKKFEAPDLLEENLNQRYQRRIFCTTFEFSHDFDEMGILFHIATNGRSEKWQNPHVTNRVIVTSSQIEVGNASDLLSRTPSELWTKDVPASWFMVDFGKNRTVAPTQYTLRHGGNYRADSLRTWDLQGSVDGTNWSVLRRHDKDASLTDKFATHTWTIGKSSKGPSSFRYFRILQTGRNSSNHNFLVLSGIEFYGDLFEWKDED